MSATGTMTSRLRVRETLAHRPVDRVPRDLWALPSVTAGRQAEFERLCGIFPSDFGGVGGVYGKGRREKGQAYTVGSYTDAWGCVWHAAEFGVIGEVKEPPLADWSALARYKPPFELLDEADFSKVNPAVAKSALFMRNGTETRPFERLQFLRGSEQVFMDFAYGAKELFKLLEMLHDFFTREMELWAKTDIEALSFMDDWGSQQALLINPRMWREIFKPLYRDYVNIIHSRGKFAFFHSDGHITAILPDLIEIGVDAINCQLFCMDIEELGRQFAGRTTFWGEMCRQQILPFGTPEDVRNAVRRVQRAFGTVPGGLIAQCEWGKYDPYDNIYALYDEWNKYGQLRDRDQSHAGDKPQAIGLG